MRGEETITKEGRIVVAIFKTIFIFFRRRALYKDIKENIQMLNNWNIYFIKKKIVANKIKS